VLFINPLVAFYDIHGGKREVIFFYFVPDTTRDSYKHVNYRYLFGLTSLRQSVGTMIKARNYVIITNRNTYEAHRPTARKVPARAVM
jgi:hypothetical protein